MSSSLIQTTLAIFKGDNTDSAPAVRFVPANYLFVHTETLPQGIQPAELENFAEVSLEGLSPIPFEQLAWGYMGDAKCPHLLLFAAFRDRLIQDDLGPDESFYHILPSFFAAAPVDGAAHWVFLWEGAYVAAVHYTAGQPIPSRVETEMLAEDNVAAAFVARERLLKRLGARAEAAPGLLANPEATQGARDRLNFWFSHYASAETEPTRVKGNPPADLAIRWAADLRGNVFRVTEQQRRKKARRDTYILQGAAGLAAILFLGQIGWASGKVWLSTQTKLLDARGDEVQSVEDHQALLKQMSVFIDNQMGPFETLGTINPLKPKTISYQEVLFSDNNKLTINGATSDVGSVDSFVKGLQSFPDVSYPKQNNNITPPRPPSNRYTFKVVLDLKKSYEPEMLAPPPPPPPPEPTPEETAAAAQAAAAGLAGAAGVVVAPAAVDAVDAAAADVAAPPPAPAGPSVQFSTVAAPIPVPAAAPDAAPDPAAGQ